MADQTATQMNKRSKCAPCVVKPDGIENNVDKNKSPSEKPFQACGINNCQCTESDNAPPKKGPFGRDPLERIDVKVCKGLEPPHPCDPQDACDPNVKPLRCEEPILCIERIKNPALKHENTRCLPGASINSMRCAKVEPRHPCDPLPICDPDRPKRECDVPSLCEHRIKNRVWPDGMKIVEECIPPVKEDKQDEEPVVRRFTPCEEIIVKREIEADKLIIKPPPTKRIHTACEENVEVPILPTEEDKQ